MADGIYVGMAAASARAAQLEAIADNLANAEAPGFKAARPAFQSFLGPAGGRTRDKILSAAVETGVDLRPGVTVPTEEPLDVVPEGDTFLAVEAAPGQVAYTRNGHIEVGADGQLRAGGQPLLSTELLPISIPVGTTPTISAEGDVMVEGSVVDRIGTFRVTGQVQRLGSWLIQPGPNGTATAEEGGLRVGELEMGNAPALESAVAMIGAQRHFETAMQAIQTYRKLDERAIEVGRLR